MVTQEKFKELAEINIMRLFTKYDAAQEMIYKPKREEKIGITKYVFDPTALETRVEFDGQCFWTITKNSFGR